MRVVSAPSVARNGAWEIICGLAQASASTPVKAEREIICGLAQASASTPRRAEREIIRDKTRASTVVGQARLGCEPWVIIRGEGTRASAAKTLARWLGRPREIICGRSRQASAVKVGARLGAAPRASGARRRRGKGGREGALVFRVILSGFMVLPRDTGVEQGRGGATYRRWVGPIPARVDWLYDSWDSKLSFSGLARHVESGSSRRIVHLYKLCQGGGVTLSGDTSRPGNNRFPPTRPVLIDKLAMTRSVMANLSLLRGEGEGCGGK